ncbi:hypothetical protein ACFY1B_17390 [Streptomyces mirabilis]|uniref:hypothetical protein n=1 Tax=Streptomyces mirabilis TaxID=68239 RepID=UPI0036A1616B
MAHILSISDRGSAEMQARLAEAIEEIPAPLPDNDESIGETHIRGIIPATSELLDVHAWLGRFRRS